MMSDKKRSAPLYDEAATARGLLRLFIGFGILMLLIVYSFAYTTWIGLSGSVKDAVFAVYAPPIFVTAGFPVVLYKTYRMFRAEKRLGAVAWVMGWASVMVVGLYYHLSKMIVLP